MEEKVYFTPGDVVVIKQEVPNKPIMVVGSVDKAVVRSGEGSKTTLFGISCFWFTTEGAIQEHRFNTKDLIHHE
jgi:hypothetical protein